MNYPIFNLDYKYDLDEIVRYLQAFSNHRIYMYYHIDVKEKGVLETHHSYHDDGLLVRLYWQVEEDVFSSGFTTMEQLLQARQNELLKLLDYDIMRFSDNSYDYQKEMPSSECEYTFFSRVMQKRTKKSYTRDEYELLEYTVSEPVEMLDILFQFLADETANSLAFERYYNERKRDQ